MVDTGLYPEKQRVCVVGGGLSGLSAAYLIREEAGKAGLPVEITLLEAEPRTGGKIGTLSWEGCLGETGPNGFLDNKPHTLDLCARMGIEGSLLRSTDAARKRYIFSGGRLQALPEDPVLFMGSDLVSVRGRIRIASEYLVPRKEGADDETLADFVRRRLGKEALDKLIGPMASGVFAGDPENMSLAACFPKVLALEKKYGGLIRGMLAMKKEAALKGGSGPGSAGPGGVLTSFTGGMGDLTDALSGRLGESVVTSAPVVKLEAAANGRNPRYRLTCGDSKDRAETDAAVVVLAIPAYASAALLRELDPGIAATMDTIPYAVMAVVHLGYDESSLPFPLDGFGFLIPKSEGRRILGSLWASSIFSGRAPAGHALLTVMIGGAGDPFTPRLDEEDLLNVARQEVNVTMGIETAPVFSRVIKWEKAIPQYTFGHLDRIESIENRLADHPGLFITGNAWRGVGINDCVAEGERAARRVLEYLKEHRDGSAC
ncbi:MAG: protoporphyrinogen oxidase [bacterium]|nr:protoporphyrinogen oxidase [bacterium]MDT8396311.1 protoporphyrinogen oxidase [bacterium]